MAEEIEEEWPRRPTEVLKSSRVRAIHIERMMTAMRMPAMDPRGMVAAPVVRSIVNQVL